MIWFFFILGLSPIQAEPVPSHLSEQKQVAVRVPGQLRLTSFQYFVNEETPYAEVAVERVVGVDGPMSAILHAFATVGAAEAGEDFEPADIRVDFEDGEEGPKVVQILIYDDDLLEGPETFRVQLEAVGDASIASPSEAIVTIVDDEEILDRGTLSLGSATYQVNEGDEEVEVSVVRTGGTDGQLTAELATVDGEGSATSGADYEPGTATVIFESGDSGPFVVGIPIFDDGEEEGTENFAIRLSTQDQSTIVLPPTRAVIQILDDDQQADTGSVRFTNVRFQALEGEDYAWVDVERVGGSQGVIEVELSTQGATAEPGQDYEDTLLDIIFEDGEEGVKNYPIPLLNDNESEDEETFGVTLSGPDVFLGTPASAVVTIEDDDPPAEAGRLQFGNFEYRAVESDGFLRVSIVRQGGASGVLEAVLETFPDGSATPDVDYSDISEPIIFQDGETGPVDFNIPIFEDNLTEGPETFIVEILNPDGTSHGGPLSQTLAIIEDNDQPDPPGSLRFSTHHYYIDEDEAYVEVVIQRIGGSGGELEAWLETDGVTADPDTDFQNIGQHISFGPGDTSDQVVNIAIFDDDLEEEDEDFSLELSRLDGPVIAHSIVTIYDNESADEPGFPQFTLVEYFLQESEGPATVTVERVEGSEGPLTMNLYTIFIESAEPGGDYEELMIPIQWADGETDPKTVEIPITDDQISEEPEAFVIALFDPLDFEQEYPYDASAVIILDDDYPEQKGYMVIAFDHHEVYEEDGYLDITVARIEGDLGEFRATLVSGGGDATPGEDYQAVSEEIVFQDGEAGIRTIQVVINDDNEFEDPPEHFTLSLLENGTNLIDETEVVIHDDDGLDTEIIAPNEDQPVKVGETVTFQGQVVGGQPDVNYGYKWEICSTNGNCEDLKDGETIEHVFTEEGVYLILCWAASDTERDTTPDYLELSVFDGELVEVEVVKPASEEKHVAVGERVAFEARVSPTNAPIGWFLLSNPNEISEGKAFTHKFNEPGRFTVVVIAGSEENYDEDYVNIVVGGSKRGVRIDSPQDGTRVNVGQAIQFVGAQVGPRSKKESITYAWAMSDGTRVDGQSGRYAFTKPGVYEVDLVGLGDNGKRWQDHVTVYVEDPSQSSIVDFNFPSDLRIEPGESVYFKARVLENKGYRTKDLTFKWDFGNGKTSEQPTPGDIVFGEAGLYTATLFAKVRATGLESARVTRTIEVKASSDSEFEPNETTEQAIALKPGVYGNLALDETSAVDVYKVNVTTAGQRLVLNFSLSGDVTATLRNAQGVELETRDISSQGNIQLQNLEPGEYFLTLVPKSAEALKRRNGLSYSIGVAVLNPALYFPEVRENASYTTQLGVVNPSSDPVSLEVIGYTAAGTPTATVQVELPARGRLHQDLTQLFGTKANNVSWVQVDATRDLVGYSRVSSRDEREVYGVTANQQLRSEVFVPHIADRTEQWYTRASVVNGTDKASVSEIRTPTASASLQVNKAFSKDEFDFLNRFNGTLPGTSLWATFKETGSEPALAGAEVFGTLDPNKRVTAGLQLADVRQDNPTYTYIGNNLYFTHIARRTEIFWTGIALVNIGDVDQNVRIKAYGDGGTQIGEDVIRTLTPGQKVVELAEVFLTGEQTPENVDWVLVEADQKIVGYELFGSHDFQRIAGLEASTGLRNTLCFPFIDASKDVGHGIAIINAGTQATAATFTLYDNEGNTLGSVVENLNPNQKFSDTIEAMFADLNLTTSQVPGWMEVTATQPLAGFELFTNIANGEQMGALTAQ